MNCIKAASNFNIMLFKRQLLLLVDWFTSVNVEYGYSHRVVDPDPDQVDP
jgi:hypothetical protein